MPNSALTNPSDVSAANVIYANRFIKALQLMVPKLDGFTTNLSDEFAEPGDKVTVAYRAPNAVSTSFTNYLTGSLAKKKVEVELDTDLYVGYPVTEKDLAFYTPAHWENQADLDVIEIGRKILNDAAAAATGAKATQTYNLGNTGTTMTLEQLGAARKECVDKGIPPEMCTLYLSPTEYAATLNLLTWMNFGDNNPIKTGIIPGLFGFKAVVEIPGLTGVAGFISAPSGVVIASRAVPVVASGIFLDTRIIKEQASGLTLRLTSAGDVNDGKVVHSIRGLLGSVVADPKAILKLTRTGA